MDYDTWLEAPYQSDTSDADKAGDLATDFAHAIAKIQTTDFDEWEKVFKKITGEYIPYAVSETLWDEDAEPLMYLPMMLDNVDEDLIAQELMGVWL